jgi:hypothetical protein
MHRFMLAPGLARVPQVEPLQMAIVSFHISSRALAPPEGPLFSEHIKFLIYPVVKAWNFAEIPNLSPWFQIQRALTPSRSVSQFQLNMIPDPARHVDHNETCVIQF